MLLSRRRWTVLQMVAAAGAEGLTPAQLAARAGMAPRYAQVLLQRMLRAGQVARPWFGVYTLPGAVGPEVDDDNQAEAVA